MLPTGVCITFSINCVGCSLTDLVVILKNVSFRLSIEYFNFCTFYEHYYFPNFFTEILIRTFYGYDVDEKITNTMYLYNYIIYT